MKFLTLILFLFSFQALAITPAGISQTQILNTKLRGYTAGTGTITSADSILTALEKAGSGGGGGTPGGSSTQVQVNSSGSFAGYSSFTFDGNTLDLTPGTDVPALVTKQPASPTADIADFNDSTGTPVINFTSAGIGNFNELHVGGPSGPRLFNSGGQFVTPSQFVLGAIGLSSGLLIQSNFIRFAAAGGANPFIIFNQDTTGPAITIDTGGISYTANDLFHVNNNTVTELQLTNAGALRAMGGLVSTRTSYSWYSAGSCSSALTVDWTNGPHQKITLTGNCTLTMSNPLNGEWHSLELIQGSGGGFTVTWPASYKWQGGQAPTLSVSAGSIDVETDGFDGSIYIANFGGSYH